MSTTRTYHHTYKHVTWIAGVPSSQALIGYLITAPPSVCIPALLGKLAVWIQTQKKQGKKQTTRKRDRAPKLEPIEWISSPSLARAPKLGGSSQMNVMNVNGSGRATSRRIDPCQNLAESQCIWKTTLPDIQDRFQTCPKRYWNLFFLRGRKKIHHIENRGCINFHNYIFDKLSNNWV